MKNLLLRISAFAFAIATAFASYAFASPNVDGYYWADPSTPANCTFHASINCNTDEGTDCEANVGGGLGVQPIRNINCVRILNRP